LAFVYPNRKEVSLNGGSAKSYATTLAYLKECKQREKNPLTGVPSHDIPLLRRERYPRGQAVAIALEEHRRRGMGNPGPHGVPPKIKERGVALGRLQEHLAKYPADRTASRNAVGWDYEIGVWPNRVEMAGFIRKQQQGTTKQWKPVVKLGETEGYSRPVSNPEYSDETQAAADLYESFHGTPSTGEVEYVETYDVPDIFAELGDLIELKVATIHGKDAVIAAPDPDGASLSDIVKLVSSPDGRQLYFLGGDQGLDLQKLGFAESEERHRMLIGVLYELTYQTKKKFHKLKTTQYYHGLGEETGNQPVLVYDPYNERMSVVGGDYHVKPEGIVN
jgi:hypothetical protein